MKALFHSLLLISLTLLISSCGKPPEDSDPPQEQIVYPDPVPDYPIRVEEPPPTPRVPPNTVPLPPPAPEVLEVEPSYVIASYKCYEGNPNNNLRHSKTIKIEKHGIFRRKSTWLYECNGTRACEKQFGIYKTTHGAFEANQYCYEHFQDQNIFSICREDQLVRVTTYRGDMLQLNGAINSTPVTIYCETSLPL